MSKPLPTVQTINDVRLKDNPRCSDSQYSCLLAVLQKKHEQMTPQDLCTFLSLFNVPNDGSDTDQAVLVTVVSQVRKVLKNEAKEQQSWGLACETFVNGTKSVKEELIKEKKHVPPTPMPPPSVPSDTGEKPSEDFTESQTPEASVAPEPQVTQLRAEQQLFSEDDTRHPVDQTETDTAVVDTDNMVHTAAKKKP